MAGIRGRRKAVVFFSEGIDYDIYNPIANTYASDIRQYGQDAIAAATRANVSFYGVDPRGLSGVRRRRGDCLAAHSIPRSISVSRPCSDELRISQDSLRTLSDETGGFAAVNSNDFGTGASSASSATTAATTCSATTRTTASATGGSAN